MYLDHFKDQFEALFEAVFAGDAAKAETLLDELQMIGGPVLAEQIRRAKRRARPDCAPRLKAPVREAFPKDGHAPGSMLGGPKIKKARTKKREAA